MIAKEMVNMMIHDNKEYPAKGMKPIKRAVNLEEFSPELIR